MASLTLLSSMAARELLAELCAQFTKHTGQAVEAQAAGGVEVARRVQAGEPVDVVVLASNAIDKLVAEGHLLRGRADLVRSGIAVAVREGAKRPDISNEEGVKSAVLAAQTLSFSTGPSGVYLEQLFARWGILDQLKARIVVPPPGVPVGSLVASGAAQLGFQQASELTNVEGITVLGPLPPAIQTLTVFSAGVTSASRDPQDARALIEFLTDPAIADLKRRYGMEPA